MTGTEQNLRELALEVLSWNYGRPYIWGGDDPIRGFDCSGLIIEVLQSVGLFPRGQDATAEGLRRIYRKSSIHEDEAQPGDLVFWMSKHGDKAVHVEMIVDRVGGWLFSMGASGGGRHIIDGKTAIESNAYVKVRPVESRKGQRIYIDPFDVPIDEEGELA